MVTVKQAIEVAKQGMDNCPVHEVLDTGESYAVCFDLGEDPMPGEPGCVFVDKDTGRTHCLPVPPIENLDLLDGLLDSAHVVWKGAK